MQARLYATEKTLLDELNALQEPSMASQTLQHQPAVDVPNNVSAFKSVLRPSPDLVKDISSADQHSHELNQFHRQDQLQQNASLPHGRPLLHISRDPSLRQPTVAKPSFRLVRKVGYLDASSPNQRANSRRRSKTHKPPAIQPRPSQLSDDSFRRITLTPRSDKIETQSTHINSSGSLDILKALADENSPAYQALFQKLSQIVTTTVQQAFNNHYNTSRTARTAVADGDTSRVMELGIPFNSEVSSPSIQTGKPMQGGKRSDGSERVAQDERTSGMVKQSQQHKEGITSKGSRPQPAPKQLRTMPEEVHGRFGVAPRHPSTKADLAIDLRPHVHQNTKNSDEETSDKTFDPSELHVGGSDHHPTPVSRTRSSDILPQVAISDPTHQGSISSYSPGHNTESGKPIQEKWQHQVLPSTTGPARRRSRALASGHDHDVLSIEAQALLSGERDADGRSPASRAFGARLREVLDETKQLSPPRASAPPSENPASIRTLSGSAALRLLSKTQVRTMSTGSRSAQYFSTTERSSGSTSTEYNLRLPNKQTVSPGPPERKAAGDGLSSPRPNPQHSKPVSRRIQLSHGDSVRRRLREHDTQRGDNQPHYSIAEPAQVRRINPSQRRINAEDLRARHTGDKSVNPILDSVRWTTGRLVPSSGLQSEAEPKTTSYAPPASNVTKDVDQNQKSRFSPEIEETTRLLSRLSTRFVVDEQKGDTSHKGNEHRIRRKRSRLDEEEDGDNERGRAVQDDDPAQAQRRAEKIAEQQRRHREKLAIAAQKRAADGKPISIPAFVTVSNLAQLVGAHYAHFSNRLKTLGFDDIFANKVLDAETAALIAQEYGFNPSQNAAENESAKRDLLPEPEPDAAESESWPIRPPVVTIMGHVDHGKTTILDFLRKANVVATEAGGITQHIGAFSVRLPATGRDITFLDTPGHAAFLAMRQRGANVTDIVVLVVAADDSVMPQTLEAIKHASAAQVPIIVAINKVDKPEADVQRVKQDLARNGIEIEDFGGDVQIVEVSGKTGQGMDALEESIITQAEILDRRADMYGSIDGWIIEATTKAAGRVATVLVRRGTLRPGSILVAGKTWARIKILRDSGGREVPEAGPGIPVEVDGWRDQPAAGDRALEAEGEQHAASVVAFREELVGREKLMEDAEAINKVRREHQLAREQTETSSGQKQSRQSTGYVEEATGQQIIPIVIKADVSGSAEAVAAYVEGIGSPLIAPKVLQSLVGAISESDIEYAAAVRGLIIGFNVETEERIKALAAANKVQILENNIIYRVVEDVREVLEDQLPPLVSQKVLGEAEIAQAFEIGLGKGKKTKIAGCKVRNGIIARNNLVRVMRGTTKVYDGSLSSLKNVKKDVTEMRKGTECGLGFSDWQEFQAGDLVQTYEEISEKQRL